MDINKLANRVTVRQVSPSGGKELQVDDVKSALKAINEQLLEDSGGDFNLYGNIRALKEVPETEDEEQTE